LFPGAAFDYDVICAAVDAEPMRTEAFYRFLARSGARLEIDETGAVVASGACVSPLLAELVRERSDALRALIVTQRESIDDQGTRNVSESRHKLDTKATVTDEDRRFEPWINGVKNAWQREQEKREWGSRRRRKGGEPMQGALGI
jgi:hypothetical protein